MKKIKLFLLLLPVLIAIGGCEEYLSVPAEAEIDESKIFATYNQFQGFVDQMYPSVLDHNRTEYTCTGEMGGECVSPQGNQTSYRCTRGNYEALLGRGYYDVTQNRGIWQNGWKVIRNCNIGLRNLKYLTASVEEKNAIEGQLLFFRAYFHFELANGWGPMPYLREVLLDDLYKPRYYDYKDGKKFQATMEYCAEDFDNAAKLLPVYWADANKDLGRITALAALSYKAKSFLWAASPLMNEMAGNGAVVHTGYMEKAALAADEAIKMAESNSERYGLMDAANYFKNFTTIEKIYPWTKETILALYRVKFGKILFSEFVGRTNAVKSTVFGGNAQQSTPEQTYIDKFEMADGTLYNPLVHDGDNALRWNGRDPRFRRAVYVHGDIPVTGKEVLSFWVEATAKGTTIGAEQQMTPYVIKKYWPKDVTDKGGNPTIVSNTDNFCFVNPQMRLAEVYLMYAEAANWAYGGGNNGNVRAPGATYTALEAVNKVRMRFPSGTPSATEFVWAAPYDGATTATGGAHGNFHTMILNERAVELCFESNHYWNDIRRYKIGETMHNKLMYTLDFDRNLTPASFRRRVVHTNVFERRQYWMPLPKNLTYIYPEFPQNEGWN